MLIFSIHVFSTYIVTGTLLGAVNHSDIISILKEFTDMVLETQETALSTLLGAVTGMRKGTWERCLPGLKKSF